MMCCCPNVKTQTLNHSEKKSYKTETRKNTKGEKDFEGKTTLSVLTKDIGECSLVRTLVFSVCEYATCRERFDPRSKHYKMQSLAGMTDKCMIVMAHSSLVAIQSPQPIV